MKENETEMNEKEGGSETKKTRKVWLRGLFTPAGRRAPILRSMTLHLSRHTHTHTHISAGPRSPRIRADPLPLDLSS